MLLTKYNTKKPTLLDTFFNDAYFFDDFLTKGARSPTYNVFDVIENDKEYEIELHLAGYNKKDLKLDVEDGTLKVSGERKLKDDTKYNVKNSYYGTFEKSFTLPKDVNYDKIDAKYVDGILRITVPKDEEKIKSKLIEIK